MEFIKKWFKKDGTKEVPSDVDYKSLYEKEVNIVPWDDMFVIVTERDSRNPFKSNGSILMETYTADASIFDAIEKAKEIKDKYGKVGFFKLKYIGTLEDVEKILKRRDKEL